MGATVTVSCINPECDNQFPLRYRSKNVMRRGMYCSRQCYGLFTPKMNDVYDVWVKRLPMYQPLRPREFMAVLLYELNEAHKTWTSRAESLGVSRLSYMHWHQKLTPEIAQVKTAMREAGGSSELVIRYIEEYRRP